MGWVWWVSLVVYVSVKYHWNLLINLVFQAVLLESWRSKNMTGFCWSQVDPRRSSQMGSKEHLQREAIVFSYCWTVIVMTVESYASMLLHWSMLTCQIKSFVELESYLNDPWALSNSVTRDPLLLWQPIENNSSWRSPHPGSFTIQAVPSSYKCAWMKMCKDSSGKEKCGPVKNTGDSWCKVEPLESQILCWWIVRGWRVFG